MSFAFFVDLPRVAVIVAEALDLTDFVLTEKEAEGWPGDMPNEI